MDCLVGWCGGGEKGLSITQYAVVELELSHRGVRFSFSLQMRRFFYYATPLGHGNITKILRGVCEKAGITHHLSFT